MKIGVVGFYESVSHPIVNKVAFIKRLLGYLKENNEEEVFHSTYKQLCNQVRSEIGIDNLIGLALHEDGTKVVVFVFDREAQENDYYEVKYDEAGSPYIEVD